MAILETITVGNDTYNIGSPTTSTGLPIGTIISFMGTIAPLNYLACNGQTVNIADYPDLADFFLTQFGAKNKFGGDGTTTIGVPDLRGEFLRGTGTNSHSGNGNGSDVGTHQNGTLAPYLNLNNTTGQTNQIYTTARKNQNTSWTNPDYIDYVTCTAGVATLPRLNFDSNADASDGQTRGVRVASRPTNTSVMYCILAK